MASSNTTSPPTSTIPAGSLDASLLPPTPNVDLFEPLETRLQKQLRNKSDPITRSHAFAADLLYSSVIRQETAGDEFPSSTVLLCRPGESRHLYQEPGTIIAGAPSLPRPTPSPRKPMARRPSPLWQESNAVTAEAGLRSPDTDGSATSIGSVRGHNKTTPSGSRPMGIVRKSLRRVLRAFGLSVEYKFQLRFHRIRRRASSQLARAHRLSQHSLTWPISNVPVSSMEFPVSTPTSPLSNTRPPRQSPIETPSATAVAEIHSSASATAINVSVTLPAAVTSANQAPPPPQPPVSATATPRKRSIDSISPDPAPVNPATARRRNPQRRGVAIVHTARSLDSTEAQPPSVTSRTDSTASSSVSWGSGSGSSGSRGSGVSLSLQLMGGQWPPAASRHDSLNEPSPDFVPRVLPRRVPTVGFALRVSTSSPAVAEEHEGAEEHTPGMPGGDDEAMPMGADTTPTRDELTPTGEDLRTPTQRSIGNQLFGFGGGI